MSVWGSMDVPSVLSAVNASFFSFLFLFCRYFNHTALLFTFVDITHFWLTTNFEIRGFFAQIYKSFFLIVLDVFVFSASTEAT